MTSSKARHRTGTQSWKMMISMADTTTKSNVDPLALSLVAVPAGYMPGCRSAVKPLGEMSLSDLAQGVIALS